MQPTNNKGSNKTPSREPQIQRLPDTISPITQGERENTTQDRSNSSSLTTRYIRETGSPTNFLGQNYIRYTNSRGVIPNYIIFINDTSVSSISATSPDNSTTQDNYSTNTSAEHCLPPNRPENHPIQEITTSLLTVPEFIIVPDLRLGRRKKAHKPIESIKK
jgi:hypothetical protein